MKLTVITPTYNRAYILGKCYESLCQQTAKSFVWLVVDDGSTDNTKELVNQWIQDNVIKIEYKRKENGGKASALNLAIDIIDTPYAVCLDSDDVFYPNTIELALNKIESTRDDKMCCGILALRNHADGTVMGGREIPKDAEYVTAEDVFLNFNLKTELSCFYKVDILKQYRFPEFPGEKFVSPGWMQYEITQKYVFKVCRDKLCCCEYVADGLTKNKKSIIQNNPRGYVCVKRYSFNLSKKMSLLMKHGILYNYGCILAKERNWLKDVNHKVWAVVLYPLGYLLFLLRSK